MKDIEPKLKAVLLEEINKSNGWQTKGFIYDIAEQEGYSPETGARYARELAEEGKIAVSYYKSKKNKDLARYARLGEQKPIPQKSVIEQVYENGMWIAKLKILTN